MWFIWEWQWALIYSPLLVCVFSTNSIYCHPVGPFFLLNYPEYICCGIKLLAVSLSLSLSLCCLFLSCSPRLPEAASNQQALSSQKGHSVPLMVFWFIPSSSLPSYPSLSPSLTPPVPPFSHREASESLPPGCQEGAGPISCRVMSEEKLRRKNSLISWEPGKLCFLKHCHILHWVVSGEELLVLTYYQ